MTESKSGRTVKGQFDVWWENEELGLAQPFERRLN